MSRTLRFLSLLTAVTASGVSFAQLAFGGQAFGLMGPSLPLPEAARVVMPPVDAEALIAADEARYAQGGAKGPWRFGFNHAVDLGMDNSGTWTELRTGRLWRLAIECPGALSINFQFHEFVVPEGGLVFVYNEMGQQLGAFTAESNPGRTRLGVTQLPGDRITVEYFEPNEVAGSGRLRIGQVTHAYRDVFGMAKGFGDSGPCNINVICPEGDDWRDQIRSTAIITTGGNGFCTGTMINNCAEDGTPYFLTADHCLGADVEDWVFRWNWDSPTCDPTEMGPIDQTVAGCQLLVNSGGTDVALLLLNTAPPPEYDVFYSGWDKSATPAERVTGIHHPAGDIKKISHSEAPVIEGTMSGADCWHVQAWDAGTTEPGSSGSGLWNQNGLLVGQLFGGQASCSFNFNDYYGRFDISYPLLQQYLGDCGDELYGLGEDPGGGGGGGGTGTVPLDAAVTSINNIPLIVCGTHIITPQVTLKNNGTQVITSMTLTYGVAGGPEYVDGWTGSLLPGQTYNYNLPAISVPAGEHVLTVTSSAPNGQTDPVIPNDVWTFSFIVNAPAQSAVLTLRTDAWGADVTWTLTSDQGTVLYSGGPYDNVNNGELIEEEFCLTNGCYTFTINDLYGDGICCESGEGMYAIVNELWEIYAESDGQYGAQDVQTFCPALVSVPDAAPGGIIEVFPVPTDGRLTVRTMDLAGTFLMHLTDGVGRRVMEERLSGDAATLTFDLSGLADGIYLLSVEHAAGRATQRIVVRH